MSSRSSRWAHSNTTADQNLPEAESLAYQSQRSDDSGLNDCDKEVEVAGRI
jgi:hypothetical protein